MKKQQQTHRQIQALFSVLSDSLNNIGVIQTINIINKGRKSTLMQSDIHLTAQAVSECFAIPITEAKRVIEEIISSSTSS